MKKSEVIVGQIYATRIDGHVVPVQILYGIEKYDKSSYWIGKNLETGGQIEIRSAARLKHKMLLDADGRLGRA